MRTFLRIFLANELGTPGLYIDPNTGGMLFQLLTVFLALFTGVLFFFSRQIRSAFARLRRMIRRQPTDDKPESTENQS